MYAINGRFLTRNVVGQERFSWETLKELDKSVSPGELELIVPCSVTNIPDLKKIRIVRYGHLKSELWEQINFCWYVIYHNAVPLNFCNLVPILKPGIVCIHDIFYKTHSRYLIKDLRGLLSVLWHRFHYFWAALFAKHIFTVSEYSKHQISTVYRIKKNRITTIYNGWQHYRHIKEDPSVFEDFPELRKGEYFFTLGSLNEYKNLRWIIESAKKYPRKQYVVTGHIMSSSFDKESCDFAKFENIFFTGFLDDQKVKSLIIHCKAFIFPSKAEGFGIPPLEALAMGVEAIVSNASCLPEIYGQYVHYLDPNDYEHTDPDELLKTPVLPPDAILKKYSWEKTASLLYDTLKKGLKN